MRGRKRLAGELVDLLHDVFALVEHYDLSVELDRSVEQRLARLRELGHV